MPVPWVRKAYARRTEKLPVRVHIRQRNAHKVTAVMDLKRWLITLTASLSGVLAVLLLCRESVAAQGVRDGIDLCITSVIPALFPFFAASQLLVSLGAAEVLGRGAGPLFRQLFGIGGAGASAFLLGLIGGYPVGAKTTESLVRQGLLPPEDGALLLTFCNNAGPAFILGITGSGVFQSPRAGVWLYLIHAAAATAVGLIFCFILKLNLKQKIAGFLQVSGPDCNFPAGPRGRPSPSPAAAFIGAVRGGVTAASGGGAHRSPAAAGGGVRGADQRHPAADGRSRRVHLGCGAAGLGRAQRPLSDGGGAERLRRVPAVVPAG